MKRTLLAALLLAGCHRPAAAPTATSHASHADMTPPPAGWSRGFGAAPTTPPGATAAGTTAAGATGAVATATGKKLAAAATAGSTGDDDANDEDSPAEPLPPELAKRASPAAGVAVWIDGALAHTRAPAELATPQRLDAVVGTRARAVFVHGDRGDEWLRGSELAGYRLRVNRRGKIKLEPTSVGGGSAHGSRPGGRDAVPEHPGRAREVRGVRWIEVRTPKSSRLAGEPTP